MQALKKSHFIRPHEHIHARRVGEILRSVILARWKKKGALQTCEEGVYAHMVRVFSLAHK